MERCRFPHLNEPYGTALREVVAYILGRWRPLGIVAAGTIVRGKPARSSDLDMLVVHAAAERQRVQKLFNGVPAEIFVNPPWQVEQYLASERRDGRPLTAHMFATGSVILDEDGTIARLRTLAARELARRPDPAALFLTARRYAAATLLEDALDIAWTDPEMSTALLGEAVLEAVRYRFWAAGEWQPRQKDLLRRLAVLDAQLAAQVREFYRATVIGERIRIARNLLEASVGAAGFFEWESEVEALPGAVPEP